MKRVLKIECERAFTGSGFKLALLIGCALAVWHALESYPAAANHYLAFIEDLPYQKKWYHYPGQLYDYWIGQHCFRNTQGEIFYLILPMLATLPFADSYFADAKDGFLRSVCIRTKRLHYYVAKYIAVFLSAFVVITVPLLLDFLLGTLFLPLMQPLVTLSQTTVGETQTFPWLFYNMPVVYVLVYTLMAGVFAGLLAVLALAFSHILNYRFLVLLAPFIGYMFSSSLFNMLRLSGWSPQAFLRGYTTCNGLPGFIGESLLLLVVSVVGFIWKGAREDVF